MVRFQDMYLVSSSAIHCSLLFGANAMHHNAGSIVLEGVDVTGYPIFSDAKVYHLYLHCLIACDLLLKCHKIPIF